MECAEVPDKTGLGEDGKGAQSQFCSVSHGRRAMVSPTPGPERRGLRTGVFGRRVRVGRARGKSRPLEILPGLGVRV